MDERESLCMSTATRHRDVSQEEKHLAINKGGSPLQNWFCLLLVFIAGAASLSVEMAASRLLAPYFGSSLFVWANLIGLILLYLTVGYYVGGLLADRQPYPWVLYSITAIAALLIGGVPLIAHPILTWALHTFASTSPSSFYGSFVSVLLLFALPTSLLGCVSPYAVRLSVDRLGQTGRVAGRLYAVSTAGSIVGTFVPVLVLLPDVGTNFTFMSSAALLFTISIIGLIMTHFTPTSNP